MESTLLRVRTRPDRAAATIEQASIDRLFRAERVEAIFADLATDKGAWAAAQLAALQTKSPQALKVALHLLRFGTQADTFAEDIEMEYRIACRVVQRRDFLEGVRAVIVDKDNAPKWNPPSLADVTEHMLDEIFAALPAGEEWSPLTEART
jgi:enoyl-CoA hydratase